jgi:hypothetical protein
MPINWNLDTANQSIFDVYREMGKPIQESEKVNCICPDCGYHTGWRRAPHWVNCGWCLSRVPKAEKPITDVIQSYLDKLGGDSSDRLIKFTELCGKQDKQSYADWKSMPLKRLEMLLSKIYLETKS